MTESFILDLIPRKAESLGFNKYHIRYRDLSIKAASREVIAAYNDLYFIAGDASGIQVESDYGLYDGSGKEVKENIHIHRGEITITNETQENKRVVFIQLVLVS